MAVIVYFSTITLLSAFAPNYRWFFVRCMESGKGGYWGIGVDILSDTCSLQLA
jgi:hypothetical protein